MSIVLCFGTVTEGEGGREPVEKYYIVLNLKCLYSNMNDYKPSNFQDNLLYTG